MYLSLIYLMIAMSGFTLVPVLRELNPFLQIVFFTNFAPFVILIGPITFIYFRFIVDGSHFSLKRDFKHLLPFFIAFINMIPFYFSDLVAKKILLNQVLQNYHRIFEIDYYWFSSKYYYLLTPIYTLGYLITCFVYLDKNYKKIINTIEINARTNYIKWLTYLLVYFSLLIFLQIILVYYSYISNKPMIYQPIFVIPIIVLLLFNLEIYNYPQILYGIKFTIDSEKSKTIFSKKSGKKIMIDHDFIQQYEQKMLEYQENLTFLGPAISVQQLAEDLNSPKYRVDYYIKNELKSNFAEIKNRYRIEYFIKSFHPSDLEKYTLDAIVKTYGFSNTQTFKREFAKVYNEKFTDYLKKI
jgi:AraC-like DNA-binding protein